MAILSFLDTFLHGYTPSLVLFGAAVLLLGWSTLRVKLDPQEPPLLKPKFPFIGHLIGLAWHRTNYFSRLCLNYLDTPIFTMPIGPEKMYIIVSPQLIQVAMRNKSISFDPVTISFAERMVGYGPNLMDLMHHPPTDGSENWLSAQHRAYDTLAPGPALNEMNARVLNSVADVLNHVGPVFETKKFYLWIRDSFTFATTTALFGAKNPLAVDTTLNDALWDFETGQVNLLLLPFPSWTAPKPYKGRARLQKGLREYFRAGYDQNPDVSVVIKDRVATNRSCGLPIDDVADHELGMLFVSTTNAIPTLFWMIYYVFRDPQLVAELQIELLACLQEKKDSKGQRECVFDIAKFSTVCPLLVSTYQETMRLTNRQLTTRTVLQDTYLNYTPAESSGVPTSYLLKKGVNIQMPSKITHFASATWGADSHVFDAKRFITSKEKERQQMKAFNPFGGGKHLCPGRHFAYAEILGAVAALVLGFEIETPEGGRVTVPVMNNNMVEAVAKPFQADQQNMLANIRRRPGWEDARWTFVTGNVRE